MTLFGSFFFYRSSCSFLIIKRSQLSHVLFFPCSIVFPHIVHIFAVTRKCFLLIFFFDIPFISCFIYILLCTRSLLELFCVCRTNALLASPSRPSAIKAHVFNGDLFLYSIIIAVPGSFYMDIRKTILLYAPVTSFYAPNRRDNLIMVFFLWHEQKTTFYVL